MRWTDVYVGLLGAVLLFGAVIMGVSSTSTPIAIGLGGAGVVLLGVMAIMAGRQDRVVVVGPGPQNRLIEELDDAGWATVRCAGPGETGCPVDSGLPCPYAGAHTVAAVIRMDGDGAAIPPCEAGIHGPALALEADPVGTPHAGRVHGRVAAEEGPRVAAARLRELL